MFQFIGITNCVLRKGIFIAFVTSHMLVSRVGQ